MALREAIIYLHCNFPTLYPLILVKSNSILFLNLHRVPNEDTNLNIQIKEDPKFNEEVENYFSKDHRNLSTDKGGKNNIHDFVNLFGRKKNEEDKRNGENKNIRNKKHDKKFTDMYADYMNFVGRNRNDRNDNVK